MTKSNHDNYEYFYTIFEVGSKGFIIKEEYLPSNLYESQQGKFFEFAENAAEKLENQTEEQLLNELGYINSYDIVTHHAEIKVHTEGIGTALGCSKDKEKKNTMYLIMTKNKMSDFSDFPRYDSSRVGMFLKNLKDKYDENYMGEFYMN